MTNRTNRTIISFLWDKEQRNILMTTDEEIDNPYGSLAKEAAQPKTSPSVRVFARPATTPRT